jgi:hypothetical protein
MTFQGSLLVELRRTAQLAQAGGMAWVYQPILAAIDHIERLQAAIDRLDAAGLLDTPIGINFGPRQTTTRDSEDF